MKTPVKKPRAAKSTAKASIRSETHPIELPEEMQKRVSRKAYELWQQRGHREAHALQEWLDAEAVLKEDTHETHE
jgi:Protein of unknown function (DUF2934).